LYFDSRPGRPSGLVRNSDRMQIFTEDALGPPPPPLLLVVLLVLLPQDATVPDTARHIAAMAFRFIEVSSPSRCDGSWHGYALHQ
jgi:hypothetical protein